MYKDILITGADDFMAPYLYEAVKASVPDDVNIWMLGTGERAGVKADLDAGAVVLPAPVDVVFYCDATDSSATGYDPGSATRRACNLMASFGSRRPSAIVYLSSVEVYGAGQGENINENTECEPVTPFSMAKHDVEEYLSGWCRDNNVALALLRPAMTVGTGMGGELRRLVNRIYRATYRHVAGNEARVSVVHATSLADAAVAVMGRTGVWNVTDGDNPTRHDLAEAFAWRLDNKRIYTVSASKARLLARIGDYIPVTGFTSASLAALQSTLTFDGSKLRDDTGFTPTPVTYYLRNHRYDESSL